MSSVIRPTPAQRTRRLLVLAAAVFAVVVPLVQNLAGLGLTQAEFAADGNSTLRVAGYAFSIWGLIYVGILAYAVRQVLPQTGESDMIRRLGWPSAVAFFGIGLWIVVAAMNLKAASVAVIFAALIALLIPLLVLAPLARGLGRFERDRLLVLWPLAALAGWLTVAAPLNLITTLTAFQALPEMLAPGGWAILAIVVTTAVALGVTAALRTLVYPLPPAWGLLGAFVAEHGQKPAVAFTALACAMLLLIGGVLLAFRLKPGVERAT
ncbi:hypothetical protein [Brevundimonas sp. UBA7534]|uniref:hypothetical protein n=1 Tax=Brevundimonas sp. UBA7534 TaxID=1946138 RepID=UPI0025BB04FD|nr:hypothetical protein [Brevundimonas sp. UBA7534]